MELEQMDRWHFADTEQTANQLLKLVLAGKKTATSSSLRGYEKDNAPLPQAGDSSIITFWDGTPGCVVKTTRVRVIPYNEMTYDIVRLEGEDDTLESWQKTHAAFWRAEGQRCGYAFSEDMPVVFEEFEVLAAL